MRSHRRTNLFSISKQGRIHDQQMQHRWLLAFSRALTIFGIFKQQILTTFTNMAGTDQRTDRSMEGHTLLLRCVAASEKPVIFSGIIVFSFCFLFYSIFFYFCISIDQCVKKTIRAISAIPAGTKVLKSTSKQQ